MMEAALARIEKQFVIPLFRQNDTEVLVQLARAFSRGGLPVVEITLMNEASHEAIKTLADDATCFVGAGTVRTLSQAERAMKDGAKFIVSPGFDDEVAAFCQKNEIAFIPGVFTPSEVQRASNRGFKVLKVFPAQAVGGASYLKHLSGPFPDLKWMATGGVSDEDLPAYISANAFAIGINGQRLPTGTVEGGRWEVVETIARMLVAEVSRLKAMGV